MSPYPAAWCELTDNSGSGIALKVYNVVKEFCAHDKAPGTIVTDGKNFFKVAVQDGYVSLADVQLAGKKRMNVVDFLRGFSTEGISMSL